MAKHRRTAVCTLVLLWLASSAWADSPLTGLRDLLLIDRQGQAIPIGQIAFDTADSQGRIGYRLSLDHHRFSDHFLSMKEMKCLQGRELWCHIPYPYSNPHTVTAEDLRWLEHDLLFLYKRPGEFGANFWNGIYYKLVSKGVTIQGEARAVDLNSLASPPDDLTVPPFGEFDLEEADMEKRWLPRLEIR